MKFLRLVLRVFAMAVGHVATANITSATNRAGPYTLTSLPATVSVVFPFQSSADLIVLNLGQNGTGNDPPTVLVLNSDYTVTGGGYNATYNMQSGNVVVVSTGSNNVQVNDRIVILRNVTVNQATSFVTGVLNAQTIERAFDKQATISQQLTERSTRALRFEAGETLDGTLIRESRAGKYLGFDSSGAIAYLDGSGGGGVTTYTAGDGLLLDSNEFSVDPDQVLESLTVTDPIVGSVTGNAATATALQNARTINGTSFNGTANITVTAAAGTLTGTILNSTVVTSSLTHVAAGAIGNMAVQNANAVAITGGSIDGAVVTGLAAPSNGDDAATKDYVDSISAGITPRTGVLVATTANIVLSAPQTIDGVAVIAGNRVLVKNQTAPEENGIYDVAAGAWTRSSDSNTAAELLFGYYYFVSGGTVNGSSSWIIQTAPTVLGVDPVVFSQFSASQTYLAGTGLGLTGNTFSINSAQSGLTLTGSAFNGTVGATTPSTGTFTTLTASGNVYGGTGSLVRTFGVGSAGAANTEFVEIFATGGLSYVNSDKTGTGVARPIAFGVSSVERARVDTAGFQGAIGATTPAAGSFTTLAGSVTATGSVTSRTLASRFANVRNVKDFGAAGDGVTNDTAAINAAVAALTNNSALYFPSGTYLTTGITTFTSLSNVLVYGEGATIANTSVGGGTNTFVTASTSSNIHFRNLRFTGAATMRGSGIHIRLYSSNSSVVGCYLTGCGDFAIHVSNSGAAYTTNVLVANNIIEETYGDGVHVGNATLVTVANNNIRSTGDDGIGIVADDVLFPPGRVIVTGNNIYNAGGGPGAVSGCGIRVNEADDVLISNNTIHTAYEAGIEVGRYLSTTAYNNRVHVKGNKVYYAPTAVGPRGSIWVSWLNESSVTENEIYDPPNGAGICFLDFSDLTIRGNTVRGSPSRAIAADDSTTVDVAANWYGLIIDANVIQWNQANEAIYAVPAIGKTINNVLITSNVANELPVGNWIYYDRVTTGKVGNNTSRDGRAVAGGGSAVGVTAFNNN